MRKHLVLLFYSLLLLSCDVLHIAQGVIIDKETKLPLSNIEISGAHGHKTTTDSIGHFYLSYVTGNKTPYNIYIRHIGYKDSVINFEHDKSQIIEIEKIK